MEIEIRCASVDQVSIIMAWAASEGWNPGIDDSRVYHAADPNGFFLGFLGEEPIASIAGIKYGDSFGFIGCYIVKPEYRGKGYGIQMWQTAMKYLSGRVIGLDAVPQQEENYKKSGFKSFYQNHRFAGVGGGEKPANATNLQKIDKTSLLQFNGRIFPAERKEFTVARINESKGFSYAVLKKGEVQGYGVLRKLNSGYKIAPLYANSLEIASDLFDALKSCISRLDTIYMDVPSTNKFAMQLVRQHDMTLYSTTARMYFNADGAHSVLPNTEFEFGVASLEIG